MQRVLGLRRLWNMYMNVRHEAFHMTSDDFLLDEKACTYSGVHVCTDAVFADELAVGK